MFLLLRRIGYETLVLNHMPHSNRNKFSPQMKLSVLEKPPDPTVLITLHFWQTKHTACSLHSSHTLSSYWLCQDAKHCHVLVTRLRVWISNWTY
jgi:hypothetical protein